VGADWGIKISCGARKIDLFLLMWARKWQPSIDKKGQAPERGCFKINGGGFGLALTRKMKNFMTGVRESKGGCKAGALVGGLGLAIGRKTQRAARRGRSESVGHA
jgi:hypothetical protein